MKIIFIKAIYFNESVLWEGFNLHVAAKSCSCIANILDSAIIKVGYFDWLLFVNVWL